MHQRSFCKNRRPDKGHFYPRCQEKHKLTSVTTLALGFISQSDASTRVDNCGLFDDKTVAVETSNVTARIGKSNLVDFIRIKPDLALSRISIHQPLGVFGVLD